MTLTRQFAIVPVLRLAAITALAAQFDRATSWVETHIGMSNSLNRIHTNLGSALLHEVQQTLTNADVLSDEQLDALAIKNGLCLLRYYTLEELNEMTDAEVTRLLENYCN